MIPAVSMNADDLPAGGSESSKVPPGPASVRPVARVVDMSCPVDEGEQELVRRSRQGDRDAFGRLALAHENGLFRYLLHMLGNADDAADQTQEAFLSAWRNLRLFDPGRPFRPWLYRIATNQAISMLRKRGRIVETSVDDDDGMDQRAALAARTPAPDQLAVSKELVSAIRSAMAQMPPMVAAALHLKYEDDKSMPEIAAVLGKSPGATAVLIHRARLRLREMIFGTESGPGGGER